MTTAVVNLALGPVPEEQVARRPARPGSSPRIPVGRADRGKPAGQSFEGQADPHTAGGKDADRQAAAAVRAVLLSTSELVISLLGACRGQQERDRVSVYVGVWPGSRPLMSSLAAG